MWIVLALSFVSILNKVNNSPNSNKYASINNSLGKAKIVKAILRLIIRIFLKLKKPNR